MSFTEVLDTIATFIGGIYKPTLFISLLVANFTTFLMILHKPYMYLGLFCTRKFKPAKAYHKYGVIIPARNEEAVIKNLIDSIKAQDYPKEYITIFVVADNCTDNTAKIARENGAVCYEHFNENERTKGFALKYIFEQIEKDYGTQSFEGYFIFDADNLLKKDYISRMNDSFDAGEKIITSYRSTKNWNESSVVSLYGLHWLKSIRFNHRPRSVLRLATNIQGTGFLFASEIVKNGWKYTSLTEDRSLTADCVVEGYQISYNNDAIFYDEQPTSLRVSLRQRLRWAKGHLQAFAESGFKLFINIFWNRNTKRREGEKWYCYLGRNIRNRFMCFDTFAQLTPISLISAFRFVVWSLFFKSFYFYTTGGNITLFGKNTCGKGTLTSKIMYPIIGHIKIHLEPGIGGLFLCLLLTLVARLIYRIGTYVSKLWIGAYLFIIERKRTMRISFWRKVWYCLLFPMYDVIERYAKIAALFMKVEWKPIPHTSKITIDDINEE